MEEPKYNWLIGPILSVSILVCGLATSWGMTKSSIDNLKTKINKIELVLDENESKIREIEIKQASSNEILKSIQSSLEEIKIDLRALRSKQRK